MNTFDINVYFRVGTSRCLRYTVNLTVTLCFSGLMISKSFGESSGTETRSQGGRASSIIGREVSVPQHLQDGQEFSLALDKLVAHGKLLFNANWTDQEGGGRPLTKGTGR